MSIDSIAGSLFLLLFLFFAVLRYWAKRSFLEEESGHSWLATVDFPKTVRLRALVVPTLFLACTLFFLFLALLDPHTYVKKEGVEEAIHPSVGRLLLLAVDRSGSMKEPILGSEGRSLASISKIDLVKNGLERFVKARHGDLIALTLFARSAEIVTPPTQDTGALLEEIQKIQPVQSIDQDGTAIGYAAYKSAALIASLKEAVKKMNLPPYDIEGAAILLFTDGLQDPNPLDQENPWRSMELDSAADYIKKWGIKLYIINVDPSLAESRFQPNIMELKRMAASTGGDFFLLHDPSDLNPVMHKIDLLEKSRWQEPLSPDQYPSFFEKKSYQREAVTVSLILLALFFLSGFLGLTRIRYQFGLEAIL